VSCSATGERLTVDLSDEDATVEHVFDALELAAQPIVDRVCASARAENRAAAQMLVSIDELYRLRLRENGGHDDWAIDTVDQVAAEVAAALRIAQKLAADRVGDAIAMRRRLPRVGDVFLAGDIDYLMFQALVSRTWLITDDGVLAAADVELSQAVTRWPSLSRGQLLARIDRIVARHDRDAVRRRKKKRDDRWVEIWDSGDGVSEIRGFLRVMDGRTVDARLDALAATVCPHDPRTHAQRRADALGALGDRLDRLTCECGRADCAAADKQPSAVTLYVVANQATVEGADDTPGYTIDPDDLVPAELVAELARSATVVPVVHPGDAPAECRYSASQTLTDFVRCRDVTCRFPGCDRPAMRCDLDHTIAFGDGGPTHASNLKCLCRIHHLLKTFGGWRDRQLRDGTVIWTSPSGETHVTTPGSVLLFPALCAPTGAITQSPRTTLQSTDRAARVPKRSRTRAHNTQLRIAAERQLNRQDREIELGRRRWEQALAMATVKDEPPPF
jgi:hypothetical protein